MSSIYSSPRFPSPIPSKRFARNRTVPTTTSLRRIANAINYAAAEQHKQVFAKAYDTQSVPAGALATNTQHYCLFRTGVNTDRLEVLLGLAPTDTSSTSIPDVDVRLVDSSGTVDFFKAYHWAENTGTYTPAEVAWSFDKITTDDGLADDTVYRLEFDTDNYARIASMSAWLMGKPVSSDTNTGIVDALKFETEDPIYDDDIQALLEAAEAVYKKNGAHLFSWSQDEVGNTTDVASSTWTNLFGGTGGYSSTTAGFYIDTQYHNTSSRADVPVQLAVYGERTSGTGNFSIRLVDSSGAILTESAVTSTEINTNPGHVVSGTIPAQSSEKIDVEIRSDDNSSNFRVYAVSLWEYEA